MLVYVLQSDPDGLAGGCFPDMWIWEGRGLEAPLFISKPSKTQEDAGSMTGSESRVQSKPTERTEKQV